MKHQLNGKILSRMEMKNLFGGVGEYGSGTCKATCRNGQPIECAGSRCSAFDPNPVTLDDAFCIYYENPGDSWPKEVNCTSA